MKNATAVPSVAGEFGSLRLGDERLGNRVRLVIDRLSAATDLGFPRAMKTERETEAFYRLLGNPRVSYRALVQAHAQQTVARTQPGATIRVIHDTTEFSFSGEKAEREGLGRIRSDNSPQGFFAHVALAVADDASSTPLGVVGAQCWARTTSSRANRKLSKLELAQRVGKESMRWGDMVAEVGQLLDGRCSAIHLMDREGDSYPLFCAMRANSARFVIRMAHDRRVLSSDAEITHLGEALVALPVLLTREVPVGRRVAKPMPRTKKAHPSRASRTASLNVSGGAVTVKQPRYCPEGLPKTLGLNVVYVHETGAPPGTDPVSWVLVTTEPVATAADLEAVVDHYRARWLIEEFFKALKTGCAFEERQLESFTTLTNALALFFPIAWQMLLLRSLSRVRPDAPAKEALTPTQIKVLQHYQPQKMPTRGATVRDALYAVAGLGGHLKNNGPPGWRTLTYGMQSLLAMADAWDAGAAMQLKTRKICDQ